MKSAAFLLSLLLKPLLPVITHMTGEFIQWVIFPAPLLPASTALVKSEHCSDMKCFCQTQGRGFAMFFCIHLDHSRLRLHSTVCFPDVLSIPFLLWHTTAVKQDPMHLWDREHPGVAGGICVQWPRIRKIRTEGRNLQPQLIILYMVANILELSKITGPKKCLHYNSTG